MGHIREKIEEFTRRDIQVAMILAQNADGVSGYLAEHPHPFQVLADESRDTVRRYGVYVRVNFESYNISRPAVFLVDSQGIIRYMYIGYHQADYPSDRELFAALDGLIRQEDSAA